MTHTKQKGDFKEGGHFVKMKDKEDQIFSLDSKLTERPGWHSRLKF